MCKGCVCKRGVCVCKGGVCARGCERGECAHKVGWKGESVCVQRRGMQGECGMGVSEGERVRKGVCKGDVHGVCGRGECVCAKGRCARRVRAQGSTSV